LLHVRLGNHHLQLFTQAHYLLVGEVTYRSGQGEIPFHSVFLHITASIPDPCQLLDVGGLVVLTEGHSDPFLGNQTSAVSSIRTLQSVVVEIHYYRRGTT